MGLPKSDHFTRVHPVRSKQPSAKLPFTTLNTENPHCICELKTPLERGRELSETDAQSQKKSHNERPVAGLTALCSSSFVHQRAVSVFSLLV